MGKFSSVNGRVGMTKRERRNDSNEEGERFGRNEIQISRICEEGRMWSTVKSDISPWRRETN